MSKTLNSIKSHPADIMNHACLAHQAIVNAGATLDLGPHTAEKFGTMLTKLLGGAFDGSDAPGIIGKYNEAQADLASAIVARNLATRVALDFLAKAVDSLKFFFGRTWNPSWAGAGFTAGTLAIGPDPMEPLRELLLHLSATPLHENATRGITADSVRQQITKLTVARENWSRANRARKETAAARLEALAELKRYLSGLREILKLVLQRDDPRWYEFGFKRPIDGMLSPVVTGVTLEPGLPGEVRVQWQHAIRAKSYRVSVLNPHGEEVTTKVVSERDIIFEGLPTGVELTFHVTAISAAGENQPATQKLTLAHGV